MLEKVQTIGRALFGLDQLDVKIEEDSIPPVASPSADDIPTHVAESIATATDLNGLPSSLSSPPAPEPVSLPPSSPPVPNADTLDEDELIHEVDELMLKVSLANRSSFDEASSQLSPDENNITTQSNSQIEDSKTRQGTT